MLSINAYACMPVHRQQLMLETCDELVKYFRQLRKMLDNGILLDKIPPFAEDKVLICGELVLSC
jgi:hypothetical protein